MDFFADFSSWAKILRRSRDSGADRRYERSPHDTEDYPVSCGHLKSEVLHSLNQKKWRRPFMRQVIFVGLDVDDNSFHGCAFLKESGEIIEFKTRPHSKSSTYPALMSFSAMP